MLTETLGTPACFGTYAGTNTQYPRGCCNICAECIGVVQVSTPCSDCGLCLTEVSTPLSGLLVAN